MMEAVKTEMECDEERRVFRWLVVENPSVNRIFEEGPDGRAATHAAHHT